jgi:hypothetical protein
MLENPSDRNGLMEAIMGSGYPVSFERARDVAETCTGIVLCILPIALWVSWFTQVLYIVLIIAAVSMAPFGCLVRARPEGDRQAPNGDHMLILNESDIAEHQSLYPMIHQNSSQARKAMAAIKSSLMANKVTSKIPGA